MRRFLVDVRDYIYILANYKDDGSYWLYTFGLILCYYFGIILLICAFSFDGLFNYLAKNGTYSTLQQYFNYIMIILPAFSLVKFFNCLTKGSEFPKKEDTDPKIFKRRLINTYVFYFGGVLFLVLSIFVFFKSRF